MQNTILSTADVARLFNVTETTVKRWADEGTLRCQKTPGGHRKFAVRNVIDFAERNNFEPSGILELSATDSLAPKIQMAVMGHDFPQMVDAFVQKALSPSKTDLFNYLSYLYEHRIHLVDIYDRVLRPALEIIGDRWTKGEIDISHEHRATYETLDALAKLQAQIMIKPVNGLVAVSACPGGEVHELGARCVSYLLESEGWTTHYLGARTPAASIVVAVRELRPDLVCLSLTIPDQADAEADSLRQIVEATHACGGRVVAGGIGARKWTSAGGLCDAVLSSLHDLLDLSILPSHGEAKEFVASRR
jgi:MerR family transcriptional regulator, light-induced transcriptional regulator